VYKQNRKIPLPFGSHCPNCFLDYFNASFLVIQFKLDLKLTKPAPRIFLLEKLIIGRLVMKLHAVTETRSALPPSQEPASDLRPQQK
jgi:hypothetical protein